MTTPHKTHKSLVPYAVSALLAPSLFLQTGFATTEYENFLQQQLNTLQEELAALKSKETSATSAKKGPPDKAPPTYAAVPNPRPPVAYNASRLSIGPYINKDISMDGSELLATLSSNREDARLLERQYQIAEESKQLGIPPPELPRIIFSGYVEGSVNWDQQSAGHTNNTQIDLSGAELDTYVQANSWVSAYSALDYDDSDTNVQFSRAFVTIGNLAKTPFYATIGQLYLPFGRYSSYMYSAPTTLGLGRVLADALVLGYQNKTGDGLHAEVYTYDDKAPLANGDQPLQYGADVGYAYTLSDSVSGETGVSYISNLADSQGYLGSVFNADNLTNSSDNQLNKAVPGYDVYSSLSLDAFNIITEYTQQLKSLNLADSESPGAQGSKPGAYHVEGAYNFSIHDHPSSVALVYGGTHDAKDIGLPEKQYGAVFNTSLWTHTQLTVEYLYNVLYKGDANDYTDNAGIALNGHENTLTASLDLYF